MVHFDATEVTNLEDFGYFWRLSGRHRAGLTDEDLASLQPLTLTRGTELARFAAPLRRFDLPHVNGDLYHAVDEKDVSSCADELTAEVAEWLRRVPVDDRDPVYVSWGNGAALVAPWGRFRGMWESLWYPFDVVDVFDDTLQWAVLFGPEEYAVIVEPGAVRPDSPHRKAELGICLVRTPPPPLAP